MNTKHLKLGLVLGIGLVMAMPALGHGRDRSRGTSSSSRGTSSAASNVNLNGRMGFGMTTYGGVPVGGAGQLGISPALDLWYEMGSLQSLQFLASIASSSPFFFSVGAAYRYNLAGNQDAGMHGGLGLNLGLGTPSATATSSSSFFLNAWPLIGFHFALGGFANNVKLSFDAGPAFAITPNFQFGLGPNSWLAGAAINYFF